jgi:pilus assembly protein Flp/PilA
VTYRVVQQLAPKVDQMIDMLQTGMLQVVARFRRDDTGVAMVEYGLLVGLIALVVGLGAQILGQDISSMFHNIGSYLSGVPVP